MAVSLGFHILFAVVGMAMPLLMAVAEGLWLSTGQKVYLALARAWSRGVAVMFAVGAVSGTVLSFELGLLWPHFMALAGPVVGMPFALEGFAFFLEAIFLGIYLYGWQKVPPLAHWLAGVGVWLAGTASGIFVVCANAWMNTPAGFALQAGRAVRVEPWQAMFNPAWFSQCLHMTLAAFLVVGFAVAAIHARMLLRDPDNLFHRRAYALALATGGICALLQVVSGDLSARHVARHQPVKLAAMEALWNTQKGAPLTLGGWPDPVRETNLFALQIPRGLSLLACHDPQATVRGLKDFPPEERPPVLPVHLAFQVMVGAGLYLAAVALLGGLLAWRLGQAPRQPWYLRLVVAGGPLAVLALEAGWTVTEVGRQPWIVYQVMRTSQALTPMPRLWLPFLLFTGLYLGLALVVGRLLRDQVAASPRLPAEGP
jgi:cytochrome d ubiquinol oxidase subunit I